MKKEEFLKKLEKKLSILNEEERQDILNEYRNHIDKKMKDGMSEKEAVNDFGDFDTLVKDILKAYKINEDYTKDESKIEKGFNIVVDEMVEFFQKLVRSISNKRGEDLLRIICKIILVLFVIWIMRVPTWIIKGLGESVFSMMPGILDHVLSTTWAILVETFYVIVSILTLYILIKKMIFEDEFMEYNEEDSIKEAKVVEAKKTNTSKKKVTAKDIDHTPRNHPNVFSPIMIIIKILVVIFTIPLFCGCLGLTVALGIMIALLFKGVYLISLFFIIIGLLMITSSILGMIYHIVWKGDK